MFASKKGDGDEDSSIPLNTATTICASDESESEIPAAEDGEPDYSPIIPIDEINVSTDSFFDNMSDNSKDVALNYFRNIGIIAPPHYDVMRHKYGDLVKGAEEDPAYTLKAGAGVAKPTRLKSSMFKVGMALLEEKNKKTTVSDAAKRVITMFTQWVGENDPQNEDWANLEVDYPDFDLNDIKQLKVEDKLKFALQVEDELRKQFHQHEIRTLKEEGAVEVNVDAHQHSIRLLLELSRDFSIIMHDTKHPMSTSAMSDFILRLKRKMRNQISAEETKTRMAIRNIMTVRRRVAHQLRCSKKAGTSISEIDFEYLTAENEIFTNEMEEMNLYLKYLKQLSSNFFHTLTKDHDEVKGLTAQEDKFSIRIAKKRIALKTFERTFIKYKNLINKTHTRLEELKRKLTEYHAPKPLEYIRLKAAQYEMESEVASLEKKVKDLNLKLITARSTFAKLCHHYPSGDQTEAENEAWLTEVKDEVGSQNLMAGFETDSDDDAPDLPPSLRQPNPKTLSRLSTVTSASTTSAGGRKSNFPLRKPRPTNKAPLETQQTPNTGPKGGPLRTKKKTAQGLTLANASVGGLLSHRTGQPVIYDTDFEAEPRTQIHK